MVKSKTLSLSDLMLSFFKFNIFEKKISSKLLIIYNLVLLFIISILGILSNNIENYSLISNFTAFLYIIFGVPLMLIILFGLYYIFLNAYEIKRKKFYEAYLVFLSILFPFVIIGNLLNIIGKFLLIPEVTLAILLLLGLLSIYFVINFVLHFRNYYKISGFKIVASLLLVLFINTSIVAIQYLTYIISILK